MKTDIYQEVTNKIINALENGVKPWVCPWDKTISDCAMPINFKTKSIYSGVNIMLLWSAADERGFDSPYWLTFKQAKELGGNVRKGEKGTQIIYYTLWEKKDKETEEVEKIPMLKTFTVFNANQIDNIEFPSAEPKNTTEFERLSYVDQVVSNTGAMIEHHGLRAFFCRSMDKIVMPKPERFNSQFDYYATLAHELTHWTGHKSRLDRKFGAVKGDSDYAFEELVAELGSAFLMADLGVNGEVQHDSYIASWIAALKNDKKFIFKAASKASKAHQWIMSAEALEQAA
ncbi:DUF1738 domain-containing protein [Vibrio harveyi]